MLNEMEVVASRRVILVAWRNDVVFEFLRVRTWAALV